MSITVKTVSARVPREIRDRGDAALKRIDSSVTDLVNAAFEYVIETGKLPSAQEGAASNKKRGSVFTQAQKESFKDFMRETSMEIAPEFTDLSSREIKDLRLSEKHGA